MEERMIIVSQVKSNRSEFMVWQVSINNEQTGMQHCTSPLKALRYCFILKKQMGVKIAPETIEYLQKEIAKLKEAVQESTEAAADVPGASPSGAETDQPKPKAKRRPRMKKSVETAAVPD